LEIGEDLWVWHELSQKIRTTKLEFLPHRPELFHNFTFDLHWDNFGSWMNSFWNCEALSGKSHFEPAISLFHQAKGARTTLTAE
jgi:hypothetical protein